MHDDKMRAQAGRHYGHKLLIGSIQDTTGNSPGVSFCHQFEGWVMIPSSQGAPPPDRRSSALVRDPLNQGGVVPNGWGDRLWQELIGIVGWQDILLPTWIYVALTVLCVMGQRCK
jgi:hypothetical protein